MDNKLVATLLAGIARRHEETLREITVLKAAVERGAVDSRELDAMPEGFTESFLAAQGMRDCD